jgi:hypothetical protein
LVNTLFGCGTMPMKRKTILWLSLATVAVAAYFGSCRFFDAQGRKFVQQKTGIPWPAGTENTRIFECPGLKPDWTEAFLVLPPGSLNQILQEHFTRYDPTLAWNPSDLPEATGDYERWMTQCRVFYNPTNPLAFFRSREKVSDRRLILGRQVYYATGDKTGFNRFYVVVDSSNGNTWIHVSYPD